MRAYIDRANEAMASCACGHTHRRIEMDVRVERGALGALAPYALERGVRSVCLAADEATYAAAGEALHRQLEAAGIAVSLCRFEPNANGDVLADADAVLQLLLAFDAARVDWLIAAGAGTIHDIVRFVAAKTGKPFVSAPTAASVDGFASAGAPMIVRGFKRTIQTASPLAIFADIDVFARAPRRLTAAGFGDMLGKATSLADWRVSRDVAGEPYCPLAYDMTRAALERCLAAAPGIAAGEDAAVATLMETLVESGLSMLMIDHSRPASGGEHHVAHMWEMQSIAAGQPQKLHGAKVGVACVLLAGLYRRLADAEGEASPYGGYAELPAPERLAAWLREAGGPAAAGELGVGADDVLDALRRAPDIRDRETGLKRIRDAYPAWLEAVAAAGT